MNANRTDKSSFFVGLYFLKQQMIVDTIITPPVTSGYCADASTCARAITNRRFATLFAIPPTELIATDMGVFFGVPSFRRKKAPK